MALGSVVVSVSDPPEQATNVTVSVASKILIIDIVLNFIKRQYRLIVSRLWGFG